MADGLPGVTDIEQYVSACRSLGYEHPDLTAHPGQVRERYLREDGMDLRALGADCAALQTVAAAADDALARQDAQLGVLVAAWRGVGADASRAFLTRHGESSRRAADAVRAAAAALADLRDRLWQAVDEKAGTVLAIGDGAQSRRADWLAAAQTVNTGSGDRAVASELVDHEVKPFVDNVIGGQFVTAVQAATEAVEAAYREAVASFGSSEATFEVPDELGPTPVPAPAELPTSPTAPTPVTPAAFAPAAAPATPASWSSPAAPPPSAPVAAVEPGPVTPAAAADPAAAAPMSGPSMPSMPSLGGGMPEIGGGLSSFGQQLGELLGGLMGDGALAEPDDLALEDPAEDVVDDEELDEEALDEEIPEDEEPVDPAAVEDPAAEVEDPPAEPVCPPPEEEPAATPPPEPPLIPPEEPPAEPPAEPVADGTPCEIAADELPQVGE
ncbi:hypothetical protein [Mycolicibacterium rutilum]|uniref:hypothetical protein n=1 Tax=Mycolicibacterium rutilum TaxID=370526 RepID=UPI001F33F8BD|nr:hypothetical protein [Mycolicibacterium rutilum]